MALTVISTNSIGAGTQFTYAAGGDDLIILSGATLASTATTTLGGLTLNDLSLSIQGTLISPNMLTFSGNGAQITVGPDGKFISMESTASNAALYLSGDGATLTNNGLIEAMSTIAVLMAGQTQVNNTGKILGGSGIFMGLFGSSGDLLTNSGQIISGNSGDASVGTRFNNAVQIEGINCRVSNLAGGQLLATSSEGNGINLSSGASNAHIYNAGSIFSQMSYGVDAAGMDITTGMTLRNLGLIFGATGSVLGSQNTDTLRNTGTLDGTVTMGGGGDFVANLGQVLGDVEMGDGNDLLNNSGGTVTGGIFLGSGNDAFVANSSRAEEVLGGDGIDSVDFRSGPAIAVALDGSFNNRGGALGDDYLEFENVFGTVSGNDTIRGNASGNVLSGRAGADNLEGAAGGDTLQGGVGADTLNGGDDVDTLFGGLGNDVFLFDGLASFGDILTDFQNVTGDNDKFQIARADLGGGLVVGQITAGQFRSRTDNVAQDADDRFIWDNDSFVLWYDKDGNGVEAAVQLALLQEGAVVVAADIFIV